jgi:predicted MFS family arabinose efflux permease
MDAPGGVRARLYATAGGRSAVIGLTGVLLGLYLARLGLDAPHLGLIVGGGLAGTATGTLLVTVYARRLNPRRALLLVTVLAALGLLCLAGARTPTLLGVAAFVGMVSGAGRDRSPAQILEQSLLANGVVAAERTRVFARYSLTQEVAGAVGALAAGVPSLVSSDWAVSITTADRWAFVGAALFLAALVPVYAGLPRVVPVEAPHQASTAHPGSSGRGSIRRLAWLFAIDSLGGGFLLSAILAYWFFQRFGLGGEALGPLFFFARGLNAASYPCAAWLARRIGLVRTMVFTHLPSSVILFCLPFLAQRNLVIALFLLREGLVQMDVPARQSYVAAITEPADRTYALGITGLVRNVGWAVGPTLAGTAMATLGLGAPLMIGAALKGVYDIALYRLFRHIPAPEETAAASS